MKERKRKDRHRNQHCHQYTGTAKGQLYSGATLRLKSSDIFYFRINRVATSCVPSQLSDKRAISVPNVARLYGPWSLSPAAKGFYPYTVGMEDFGG